MADTFNSFDNLNRFRVIQTKDDKVRLFTPDLNSDGTETDKCLCKDLTGETCLDNTSIIVNLVDAVNT